MKEIKYPVDAKPQLEIEPLRYIKSRSREIDLSREQMRDRRYPRRKRPGYIKSHSREEGLSREQIRDRR